MYPSLSLIWLITAGAVSSLATAYAIGVALRLINELQLKRQTKGFLVLTFDDGPSPIITRKIRELLQKEHVKATFFVSGSHGERHSDLLSKALQEGHEIGSHGYSHLHGWRQPFASLFDILYGLKSLRKVYPSARLFRPPFGKATLLTHLICWFQGYRFVYWTIDCKDAEIGAMKEPREIVAEFLRNGGGVILLHDLDMKEETFPGRDVKVLAICAALIECAKARGMSISTVSEILTR